MGTIINEYEAALWDLSQLMRSLQDQAESQTSEEMQVLADRLSCLREAISARESRVLGAVMEEGIGPLPPGLGAIVLERLEGSAFDAYTSGLGSGFLQARWGMDRAGVESLLGGMSLRSFKDVGIRVLKPASEASVGEAMTGYLVNHAPEGLKALLGRSLNLDLAAQRG